MSSALTYGSLALCVLVFAGSFWMSSTRAPLWLKKWAKLSAVLQLAAMLGAYAVLRPGSSSDVDSLQARAVQQDKLLFLSFHSNH